MSSPFAAPSVSTPIDAPERRLLSPAFALLVGVQLCFGLLGSARMAPADPASSAS